MEKKKLAVLIILSIAFIVVVSADYLSSQESVTSLNVISITQLPSPQLTGNLSVEQAIANRRSVRKYSNEFLTLEDVSQLLWAAQGITDSEKNLRAAPSAGQVYPLEVYVVVGTGSVSGLQEGLYHYVPQNNTLEKLLDSDIRNNLSVVADGQPWVKQAPINIIITGNYQKMLDKYKDKDLCTRFVNLEAGHVGENIYLQAESLGLVTVALGSFDENQMVGLLHLPINEKPIYIFPVGYSQS
ncbi:SagB/ThcOx family dehydrogenase [Methanobacterium paludis]|uniref:SagB-type dehydrogenase domain protein n=1 Tax=Methanobacterium paludis (strain DSM 25820 / JCM 18151 / SWAN1) TaxID=868131 RepID=F6D362_METPW|nr:SagB/ThcOx family dehydrogenase [Methanobacterium paludis]AEG18002.1 SagB-type dehydrogenase domain protein [Methanobacterium paludis]